MPAPPAPSPCQPPACSSLPPQLRRRHGETDATYWHVINLEWPQPRGGIRSINVLSLHINNIIAKKPVAGPRALEATLGEALGKCPEVDFVTGDLNGARNPSCLVTCDVG